MMSIEYTGTFCPECGFDVSIDQEGCCMACGASALGEAVEKILMWRTAFRMIIKQEGETVAATMARTSLAMFPRINTSTASTVPTL